MGGAASIRTARKAAQFNFRFRDFGFESLMSPWLTTKHQNSQQSPGRNFNKLRLFWKELGFCPILRFFQLLNCGFVRLLMLYLMTGSYLSPSPKLLSVSSSSRHFFFT